MMGIVLPNVFTYVSDWGVFTLQVVADDKAMRFDGVTGLRMYLKELYEEGSERRVIPVTGDFVAGLPVAAAILPVRPTIWSRLVAAWRAFLEPNR